MTVCWSVAAACYFSVCDSHDPSVSQRISHHPSVYFSVCHHLCLSVQVITCMCVSVWVTSGLCLSVQVITCVSQYESHPVCVSNHLCVSHLCAIHHVCVYVCKSSPFCVSVCVITCLLVSMCRELLPHYLCMCLSVWDTACLFGRLLLLVNTLQSYCVVILHLCNLSKNQPSCLLGQLWLSDWSVSLFLLLALQRACFCFGGHENWKSHQIGSKTFQAEHSLWIYILYKKKTGKKSWNSEKKKPQLDKTASGNVKRLLDAL